MAIAHGTQARWPTTDTTGFDTTVGTRIISFTPGATPAGIIVQLLCTGTAAPCTGITYAGLDMLLVADATDTSEAGRVQTYVLLDQDIPTGTQDIIISGAIAASKWATIVSVTSATNRARLTGAVSKNTTTGTNPFALLTTDDTSWIYMALHGGAAAPTSYVAPAGKAVQFSADYGALAARTARSTATAVAGAGVSHGFTFATSEDYCITVIGIGEAQVLGATRFSAATHKLTFADSAAMDDLSLDDYLILMWVYPESGGNNNGRLFSRADTSAGGPTGHMQVMVGNGLNGTRASNFTCRQKFDASPGVAVSGGVLPNLEWSCIGGHFNVADSGTRWRLFEAGAVVSTVSSGNASGSIDFEDEFGVAIGNSFAADRDYLGRIAYIAIWDVSSLTDGQVETLASDFTNPLNGAIDIPHQSLLVEFLRLDGSSGLEGDKGVLTSPTLTGAVLNTQIAPLVLYNELASSVTYEETGALVADTALVGGDASERNELGSLVADTTLVGIRVREFGGRVGAIIADTLLTGISAAEKPRFGSLITTGRLVGIDVSERAELGSLIADTLLVGIDSSQRSETGSLIADSLLVGIDISERSETGALIADSLLAGVDINERSEAGSLTIGTLLAGTGIKEGAGKSGVLLAGALIVAINESERSRSGSLIGDTLLAALSVEERNETGSLLATTKLAGIDSSERNESGSLIADTLLDGLNVMDRIVSGVLVADTLLAGTGVRATEGREGSLTAGALLKGISVSELSVSGSLLADTLLAGIRERDKNRAGSLVSDTLLAGRRNSEYARAATLMTYALLRGADEATLHRLGSLIAGSTMAGALLYERFISDFNKATALIFRRDSSEESIIFRRNKGWSLIKRREE